MEAGEYGRTHGTYFVARRFEVVSIAGVLWNSCCVLGAVGFRGVGGRFFPSLNAHGLLLV